MWARARVWMSTLVKRDRFEGELADELAFHLQSQVDSLQRRGMAPAEARRRARLEFGNPEKIKEDVRDVRLWVEFEQLRQDLASSLRLVRREPGASLGIVLILAAALGITTAIWSVADKSLLRPLPFEDASRLVWLRGGDTRSGLERMPISYRDFRDWRERNRSFDDLAAWRHEIRVRSDGPHAEQVRTAAATDNLYELVGTTPLLGRLPRSETDAVLSHAYWNGRFDADPNVVGSSLRLDERSFTVAGVLPARFAFPPFPPDYRPEVWVPLDRAAAAVPNDDSARDLWAVGRLAANTSIDAARREVNAIALERERADPVANRAAGVSMGPLNTLWSDRLERALPAALLGAVLALFAACSNVVGLLVGRAMRRRREFAVRAALGAGTARLARQLATEVGLLFVAGTAAGLVLAHATLPLLVRQLAGDGSYLSAAPQVDLRVFTVVALVAAVTAVLTSLGLVAGIRPGRGSLSPPTSPGNAPRRSGMRRGLLVVQVGISMVVIFVGALLTASFGAATTEPVGFDMEDLLALRIATPAAVHQRSERMAGLLRQVRENAGGVTPAGAAALAGSGPFGSGSTSRYFEISQQPVPETVRPPLAGFRLVSRNYFDVLGLPVLRGRGLPDYSAGVLSVVVNQAFVNRHFGSADPIGAGLWFFSALGRPLDRSRATAAEIVGVVANEKFWRLDGEMLPQAYADIESQPPGGFDLLLRTQDPETALGHLRTELAAVLPGLSIDRMRRIEDSGRATLRGRWLGVVVMDLFALLAAALAAIGVHAVLTGAVHERRQELAIRSALGALPSDLVRLVVRDGLLLAAAGIALGVFGSLAAAGFLAGHVYAVSATDPLTLFATAVLLLFLAVAASWLPARRAGRTEPVTVLREV